MNVCSIGDCAGEVDSRGWCSKHYQRWKKYGDARHVTARMMFKARVDAFWREIELHGDEYRDECHEWPGGRSSRGYGMRHGEGERTVSREVWVRRNGPIPDGLRVLHHCDNRPCGWPTHLFLGTCAENTEDMMAKGRHVAPRGEWNGRATITDALVAELRQRAAGGASFKSLAREIGVHPVTVSRICRGLRRS